jgi:hypothetical protein
MLTILWELILSLFITTTEFKDEYILNQADGYVTDEAEGYTWNEELFNKDHDSFLVNGSTIEHDYGEYSDKELTKYKKIWNRILTIFPDEYEYLLGTYQVTTEVGNEDYMAYVEPHETNNTWTLNIDINYFLDQRGHFSEDANETIIHEFAHILTLNHAQIDNTLTSNTFENEDGKFKDQSYLNQFYQQFWKGMEQEYNQYLEDDYEFGHYNYYDDNPNDFVSDYAATNIAEDIAESFMIFIIEEKPSSNQVKDQKVRFFYQFSELVKMRNDIRKNIGM